MCDYGGFFVGTSLGELTEFVSLALSVRAWGERYRPLRASAPILEGASAIVPADWGSPGQLVLDGIDLDDEAKALLSI
jgi:hypothetical protein